MTTPEETVSQTVTIHVEATKGVAVKTELHVAGPEADRIQKHLDVSYTKLSISPLHKGFLKVVDLDGNVHFFCISTIQQVHFRPKAVA